MRKFEPKINASRKCSEDSQDSCTRGTNDTWDMAKIRLPSDIEKISTKEKEYRRLLVDRFDKGKHSEEILDLHLVVNGISKW